MMRALSFAPSGLLEQLQIVSVALPKLRERECMIRVMYAGLNRADLLQMKGQHPPPPGASDILGLEVAGIIDEVAPGVDAKWRRGDHILCLLNGGGLAERVAVDERLLMHMPAKMGFREAAALPEAWLTAFQLLFWVSSITHKDSAKLVKDSRFLVHAAASGVGTTLVQMITNVLGAEVYATVGSEAKASFLESELHVTKAFNYKNESEENFGKLIQEKTQGAGVDVVFDCVGASYWQRNCESMAMDSEWVLYGLMGGGSVEGDLLSRLLKKRIQLKTSTLRHRSIEYKHRLISDFEATILPHFGNGNLRAIIDKVFTLDDIRAAYETMASNQNTGKIVVKIGGDDDEGWYKEL